MNPSTSSLALATCASGSAPAAAPLATCARGSAPLATCASGTAAPVAALPTGHSPTPAGGTTAATPGTAAAQVKPRLVSRRVASRPQPRRQGRNALGSTTWRSRWVPQCFLSVVDSVCDVAAGSRGGVGSGAGHVPHSSRLRPLATAERARRRLSCARAPRNRRDDAAAELAHRRPASRAAVLGRRHQKAARRCRPRQVPARDRPLCGDCSRCAVGRRDECARASTRFGADELAAWPAALCPA